MNFPMKASFLLYWITYRIPTQLESTQICIDLDSLNQRNLKWCSGSWASQNRQKEKSQSKVGHRLNVDFWEVLWLPGQNLSGSNVRSNN